jgi:4'-phosphopantetheinyl transferase
LTALPSDGATEVWCLRVDERDDPVPDRQLAWLTPDELGRARRFRFERDRRLYLASRVMLRSLLSRYGDAAPAAWRFRADRWGKPRIASPAVAAPSFSLAHTRGLVCCAFSAGPAVGVDAEALDTAIDVSALSRLCCSPLERLDLEALGDRDQPGRFLAYWTLKESLSKAIGRGLSMDVSRLSFQIEPDRIRVRFGGLPEDAPAWRFGLFQPTSGHTVGVSVRAASKGDLPIRLREAGLGSFR